MRPWLELTRIRLSPTAVSNVWLGLGLTIGVSGWPVARSLAFGLLAWVLYLFGMAMNDFADRERDRTKHPDRALPSGTISARAVARGLVVLALVAVTLAYLLGIATLGVCGTIIAFIATYNFSTKDHPIAGPLAMGAVRSSLVILGATQIGWHSYPPSVWIAAVGLGGYVALVTYYSLAEDDPTRHSLRRRAEFVRGWVVVVAAASIFDAQHNGEWPWLGIAGWLGAALWTTHAIAPLPRGGPPFLTTLRFLRGLFALDMAMALTYDLAELAFASAVLAVTTLTARRS